MAGYSSTPLTRKLGIKDGHRLVLLDPPEGFHTLLEPLPVAVRVLSRARKPADVIVCFCRNRATLAKRLPTCLKLMHASSGLWIGWPKKSSGVGSDLDFDHVQRAGLAASLVDNKICALDDTWSGLRLVVRVKDRPAWSER